MSTKSNNLDRFTISVEMINKSGKKIMNNQKISNDDKLLLYSFYKQSTVGNCNTKKPSSFNFEDAAKWDAWNKLKGMSTNDAMGKYADCALHILQLL